MSDKKSTAWMQEQVEIAQKRAPIGSAHIHLKTGNTYTVTGHCFLEASVEVAVLYAQDAGTQPIWARVSSEFFDGRFQPIEA